MCREPNDLWDDCLARGLYQRTTLDLHENAR